MTDRKESWFRKANREAMKAGVHTFFGSAGYMAGVMLSFIIFDWLFFDNQMIEIVVGVTGRTLACVLELPI